MTEWRTLDWLPGYEISENGEVRRPPDFIYKSRLHHSGYVQLGLLCPEGRRTFRVHRLVCEAFHGPPGFEGAHTAHWDGDKLNNHFSNLRWATSTENHEDSIRLGTTRSGERCPNAVLDWSSVRKLRAAFTGEWGQIGCFARQYGVSESTMRRMLRGKTWHRDPACDNSAALA